MLLAFDTATSRVTVALHDGTRVVASHDADEAMRHGEMLAPGIARVLAEAGATVRDLTGIAVGVGPGPFTGLRVGLVTARTLALVRDLPVHGVCTLDVLAAEAVRDGLEGDFSVATDARRKEVYLASYAGGRRVAGPVVVRPADADVAGPVVGRGAVLYPEVFGDARGPEQPSAAVLAEAVRAGTVELLSSEPLYLRRPDATAPGKPKRVS
ncbi:tRNA threonylcarbamoyl adenosine modification protein YeaZ [Nocardioides scoriae]|uniref:tRNA threonylcarbamoyl adenosine modification protein YeaZ n=1 Tax=Nocardioides scoriae TaxID=642780 RepID=A0A1H1T0G0_9ACTN|nr:tRNA (adenosine(37)-N6)-threonylcarbamoyltransferase complex dimerization subunit type 1 TsaB [Nocardioides scoriae]SDS53654.1 tRNA threonylcarbamoyl adenosine modification protein YeaZ [Nocardioides scoriae]